MAAPARIRSIFLEAVEQHAPEQWRHFLDQACGTDQDLRQRVEMLLRAHEQANSMLDAAALPPTASIDQPATETPGTMIGPYKLLQQIGEGGMGTVFMAEQTHPIQRKVALKIIKPGMDSKQIIARFEAERQALAMMDHVNIARVYDGGTVPLRISDCGMRIEDTSERAPALANSQSAICNPQLGRPYFVMELVHGVPITKYCDDNHLTPRERLELFVPVCQAIQHAHQKGIIHRDIKPSNVMVTLYDGKPVPKVIDFGVAKATEQKLTERTLFTQYGTMVGTLEYMSPEQAEMSALGVDTRSDIYSLGVLLYELLTGSTPLTHQRMKEAAYAEILRMIKEEEPPKPSTRLSETRSAERATRNDKAVPRSEFRVPRWYELDWIVMKTLEKDRNRRYETANGFAADVQRYLNDEPVQACPPSARYRLRKFVRRNKGSVLAASIVGVTLLGGMVGTTLGLLRANSARHQADRARAAEADRAEGEKQAKQEALAAAEAEKKAKEAAKAREAETRAVLDFVQNKVVAAARPKGQLGGLGRDVTVRQAVEAALPFVEKSFRDQPLIEAKLRTTLGLSFLILGDAPRATEQNQKARALYFQHRGPDDLDTLASTTNLAQGYRALGRTDDARKLAEETLTVQKAKLGHDHHETLRTTVTLANCYQVLGRTADAIHLTEEALPLMKAKFGPDNRDTLVLMGNLAIGYDTLDRYADALKIREEVLALMKASLGPEHPDTLIGMLNLASSYTMVRQHEDAVRLHEQTLPLMKASYGLDHQNTLHCMSGLAEAYRLARRPAEALKFGEESVALLKAKLGIDHPSTLGSMYVLGNIYMSVGRNADALKLREETLALRKAKLGAAHPETIESMNTLAQSYEALGRHPDALKLREEALELKKAKLGPDHVSTLGSMHNLAKSFAAVGRYADSVKFREQTLALATDKLGLHHHLTLMTRTGLAWLLATCADPKFRDAARALELAEKSVMLAPKDGICWSTLGVARYRTGAWKAAIEALEKAMALIPGEEESFSTFFLAMAHWQLGNKEEARKWYDRAVQWMEKNQPQNDELRRFQAEAAALLGLAKQRKEEGAPKSEKKK